MYHTTDVNGEVKSGLGSNSGGESAGIDEKFSLQFSYATNIFGWGKQPLSDSASTVVSTKGLKDCCTTCISILVALCLTFIIVLWVVALIADGPDEFHSCVILWPIVAGILIISVLFILLRGGEYCIRELHRHRNLRKAAEGAPIGPLGVKDSLKIHRQGEVEAPVKNFVVYEQHTCVSVSYVLLTLALFAVMIASVVQYFTLDSSCYTHLQDNVEELLLGYEVLAYMSVVVLSLLSCVLSCLLFGIIVRCLKS